MTQKNSNVKKDNKDKEIETKAKELARLIFLRSENIDQICITGIGSKKSKDFGREYNGFDIRGLCLKKKDILPDKVTKTKIINKAESNK